MSRIYYGIGILLLLLLLCSLFSLWSPRVHLGISGQLEQAAAFACQGDWPQAAVLANQAAAVWKKAHGLTAVSTDHAPMEQIDALFAELQVYAARRDMPNFAATAAHLSRLTAALGNNHGFSLRNLL